jgi:hypothetical protein
LPSSLATATVKTALTGGASPQVAALTEGVVQSMVTTKLKAISALLVVIGILAAGAGVLAQRGPARSTEAAFQAGGGPPPAARPKDKPPARPTADGKHTVVSGRVVDAAGKAVAGARVALVARRKTPTRGGDLSRDERRPTLAQGRADGAGNFRFTVPRTSTATYHEIHLLAGAPGHGLTWHDINPDAPRTEATLKLPPEKAVRGRLVDVQGHPAAGVTVRLSRVGRTDGGTAEGIIFWDTPKGLAAWPGPVTTDKKGRFVFPGVNSDQGVWLEVQDDRFAPAWLDVNAFKKKGDKEFQMALAPSQLLEGRVLYADTGKPAPNARLTVYTSNEPLGGGSGRGGQADEQGRFRINPVPGKYLSLAAYAADGHPYMTLRKNFPWPKGAVKHTVDMKLPRGILVRGKVTEAGSGKALEAAAIHYHPNVAKTPRARDDIVTGWEGIVVTDRDGVFQVPVLPGEGHLLVNGPTPDYIHLEVGSQMIYNGRPGGQRYYPDGLVKLTIPPDVKVKEVAVQLRRGVTVRGKLVSKDGQPVAKGLMIHRLNIAYFDLTWRFPVEVLDSQFEIRGLDPEKSIPVYFIDQKRQWGATVQISGKQAGKPLTVRLAPCGKAAFRLVDKEGQPVKNMRPWLMMVVTPGAFRFDQEAARKGMFSADEGFIGNLDRVNHWHGQLSDAQGRCTLGALIPGATYRFALYGNEPMAKKEFKAESGKTLQLGDITMPRME